MTGEAEGFERVHYPAGHLKKGEIMKKIYMFLTMFLLSFNVFATSEVAVNSIKGDIKELIAYTIYTFLLALTTIIFNSIRKAIDRFVDSKKGDSYYQALKHTEELVEPLILEAEEKAVRKIKEKYDKTNPERYAELGKIFDETLSKVEKMLPVQVKADLEKTPDGSRGLIAKLLEKKVKQHKYLKFIDFRQLRDKLNIPKI